MSKPKHPMSYVPEGPGCPLRDMSGCAEGGCLFWVRPISLFGEEIVGRCAIVIMAQSVTAEETVYELERMYGYHLFEGPGGWFVARAQLPGDTCAYEMHGETPQDAKRKLTQTLIARRKELLASG